MKLRVFLLLVVVNLVRSQPKCPAGFTPPTECFPVEDIKGFGPTSKHIETLYNHYVNLLTQADLNIDGDEPGVNLFFGGELSQKVRKLKYFGNSLVTFLEVGLHRICRDRGLKPEQFMYCLSQANVTADFFDVCEKYDIVDCKKVPKNYQPINGVCANPDKPYKGAINTPYARILPNSFDDSIHEVRSSVHDSDLPSARLISTGLRTLSVPVEFETPGNLLNDFILFYSSQVVYDIAKTLKSQTWEGNYGFECCDCDGRTKIAPRFYNRHCMPIDIPEKDATHRGRNCMNYIRAMVTHDNCEIKEAQFLNAVTHFMDMDFLYVPETVQESMRNGGKFGESGDDIHRTIILGDERSAQFPQFFALVVVWVKFHNRVVDELTRLYPNLPTNAKFYEARRFVIAVYQNIFYSEVLPLLVSDRNVDKYQLHNKKSCYDPKIDPSIPVEFTSSAARFFHTYIQNSYTVNFKNGTKADILLRNLNDESLGFDELAGVITGLLFNPWNSKDIANEPSNYLFTTDGGPGLDLRAMDLQTERDLGIGTYCDALYHFNLTKGNCIKKFSDFAEFISEENLAFIKYAYEVPCDVDFGVGASMHISEDGLLSDIYDNVFASTFKNLKCGDPYFYTNSLSEDQIELVSHFGLKDVLCLTIPDLPHIQPFVCLTPGVNNTVEACNTSLQLDDWKLTINPNIKVTNIPTLPPDNATSFTEPTEPVTPEPSPSKIY